MHSASPDKHAQHKHSGIFKSPPESHASVTVISSPLENLSSRLAHSDRFITDIEEKKKRKDSPVISINDSTLVEMSPIRFCMDDKTVQFEVPTIDSSKRMEASEQRKASPTLDRIFSNLDELLEQV